MQTTSKRRLILDAAVDGSVIHGTLTAPSGVGRDFYGWLELSTALEAMFATSADHVPNSRPVTRDEGDIDVSHYFWGPAAVDDDSELE